MTRLRTTLRTVANVIASRAFLAGAIGLLAVSSVLGSGGLVIAQGHQEHDKHDLLDQLADAKAETAEVKSELAATNAQSKCRAQLAANAEVYSGQINVGIAQLVVDAQTGNVDAIPPVIDALQAAIPKLTAALKARQDNVATCTADPTTPTTTPTTAPETTTTTTTAPRLRRTTSAGKVTSTTTGTTTTTVHRSSPTPSPAPEACMVPISIPIPLGIPGVGTCL